MSAPENPRRVAIECLVRVEQGAYSHILVPEVLRRYRLDARDRAHVTDLVYGTIRWQRLLDWLVVPHSSRSLDALDPEARAALRMGAYQLWSGVAPHAAVGETAGATPARARGFVNAVLRAVAAGPPLSGPPGTSVSAVGVRTSHPDWIVALLREEYGESDALAVLELDNVAPAVSLRINRTCATAAAVERELQDAGVDVARGSLVPDALLVRETGDVGALPAVREGRATPQDQASQAIVGVLDPQPGERVLDVASAPGGKATGSAERMDDDGLVVAADLFPGRVRTVRRAARRLGLRSLVPLVSDGRSLPVAAGAADRVLLDAPCSGLGVLRRRPDARWRVTRDDVAALAGLQQDLLREVAPVVRPGGRLVYAVCTLTRAETADVDAWARAHLPEFVALDPPGAPWRPHGRGAVLLPSATEEGTDGMYVLALERAAR